MKKENMPENDQVKEPEVAAESAAPETFQARVPAQKRTALLRYMAVMFAAAFLLVLLSFVMQMRSSNTTISHLSQSSASALARAEQLQEDNRELVAELSSAKRYIGVAREEGEENVKKTQTAYDALMIVLAAEPKEGDVALASAEQTVMDLKEFLSEEALALFEEHMAQYGNDEKER